MWKIAYRLVREYAYTVLHSDSDSIHLMRHKGRSSQYVQLRLCDFLWGATVHNYLEETAARLEGIRQQIGVRTVKGFVVFIMRQPFLGAAEETVHKQPGIDELGISLSPAAYVPEERQWVTGGQYTSAESAILERLFTETTVSETDPPAPFWANEIEQWEIRKQREIEAVFFYGKPRVTYVFLILIATVFILMELSGGSQNMDVLISFGAKYNPLIQAGEWWRFITPIFLHIGFMHILFNGMALHSLGTLTEQLYGPIRFFFIYMAAGICGVTASYVFSPNLSAGASGAIFGLFGSLLYFGTQNRQLFYRTLGSNVLFVLGINLVIGFLYPNVIDNFAHLGGLFGGFLSSAVAGMPGRPRQPGQKLGAAALLLFLLWIGMQSGGWQP